MQRVNIALRVLYRPGDNLPMLYKNFGKDYAQRVIPGIGQEVLKGNKMKDEESRTIFLFLSFYFANLE